GARSRGVYLPRGGWADYGTEQAAEGGREIERAVDLATMPLYVRAGAIVPMGPVKQFTAEQVEGPLTVNVYPGDDGALALFEDDGRSFAYRNGAWTGLTFRWNDRARRLSVELTPGSKMRPPLTRDLALRVA